MTEKHRLAISRGLRKLRKRRRLSAAMKASWVRRRNEANTSLNHVTPQRFQADVEDNLVSQIVDLIDENARYRALIDKLHNALSK